MSQERFENFEILRRPDGSLWELGRGGMGVTYKARDTDLYREAALKIIHPAIVENADAKERFLREARAAARLQHPNIAGVMRLGRAEDGSHYYAMDYCEGPTLDAAVASRGALPPAEAAEIAKQVCAALVAAEAQGIVHRDLKPSNLILTERTGEGLVVKVIDFGLAKGVGDMHQTLATAGGGGFSGTAHFASPEQLEELPVDCRSDLYSLGACLWFMLTGAPVFDGSLARVMSQTLNSEPNWEKLTGQPESLIVLLRSLLSKLPDGRPVSAIALKAELDNITTVLGPFEWVPSTMMNPARQPSSRRAGVFADTRNPVSTRHMQPTAALAPDDFSLRFPLFESLGREALGRSVRGIDVRNAETPVRVLAVDPMLTSVPAIRREVLTRLATAMSHPHQGLQLPLAYTEDCDGILVAFPLLEGQTLMEILQSSRGQLPPQTVASIVTALSDVADHASIAGLAGTSFAKEEVLALGYRNGADWNLRVPILSIGTLGGAGQEQATLFSMATRAPSSSASVAAAGYPAATVLARLACELLGGQIDGNGRIAPLPSLSEAANGLLSKACSPGALLEFPSARAFVTAWCPLVATTTRTRPSGTAESPSRPHSPPGARSGSDGNPSIHPRPAFTKNPFVTLAGICGVLALLTAGWYYGLFLPREEARRDREAANDLEMEKLRRMPQLPNSPVSPIANQEASPQAPAPSLPPQSQSPIAASLKVKEDAQLTTSVPQTPATDAKDNIAKFVGTYLETQNKRDTHSASLLYADTVSYFKENLSRAEILETQEDYFRKNPQSHETLAGTIQSEPSDDGLIKVVFTTNSVVVFPEKNLQVLRSPKNIWFISPKAVGAYEIVSQDNNSPEAIESPYKPNALAVTNNLPVLLDPADFGTYLGVVKTPTFAGGVYSVSRIDSNTVIFNPIVENGAVNKGIELHVHFLDGIKKMPKIGSKTRFIRESGIQISEIIRESSGKTIAEAKVDSEL